MRKLLIQVISLSMVLLCSCNHLPAESLLSETGSSLNTTTTDTTVDTTVSASISTTPQAVNTTINWQTAQTTAQVFTTTVAETTKTTKQTTTTTKGGNIVIETNSNILPVTAANVRVNGRYHLKDLDLAFSNSYAGIQFAFKGTAVVVEFAATKYNTGAEIYAKVYVDDLEPVNIKIDKPGYYTIVTNLDGDKIHQVRIAKRSESNVGAMIIRKLKINPGGQFYTPKDAPSRKILVLGDSIACGYGNLYTGGETVGSTAYEDGCQTFATMLADT